MRNFTVVLFLLVCFLPFAHGQETGFGQELPKAKPGPIIRSKCTFPEFISALIATRCCELHPAATRSTWMQP